MLVQEEGKSQKPIYYVSRVLHGAETRYRRLEKMALALIMSARKLRPYFQSHQIMVKTDQPIRQILQKPDLAGRMVSWAVELSEFDIRFVPKGPVKDQAIADFVAELTRSEEQIKGGWTLYVDGSSN